MKSQTLQPGLLPRQHTTLMVLGLLALVVTLMLLSHPTFAGTGGAEFTPLYTKLSDWMTGYQGRVVVRVRAPGERRPGAGRSAVGAQRRCKS